MLMRTFDSRLAAALASLGCASEDQTTRISEVEQRFEGWHSMRLLLIQIRDELPKIVAELRKRLQCQPEMCADLLRSKEQDYDFFFLLAISESEWVAGHRLAERLQEFAGVVKSCGFRLPSTWYDTRKLAMFPE